MNVSDRSISSGEPGGKELTVLLCQAFKEADSQASRLSFWACDDRRKLLVITNKCDMF